MHSTAAVAIKAVQEWSRVQIPRIASFRAFSLKITVSLPHPLNRTFNEMHWCPGLSMKNAHDIACVSVNDDLSSALAFTRSCVIFECFNWLACLMYNHAKFYAALAAYLPLDFFLSYLTYRSRASTWSTWKWASAYWPLKNIGALSEPWTFLRLSTTTTAIDTIKPSHGRSAVPPWNKLFGNRSVNRFCSIFSPPLYRSLRRKGE